MHIVFFDPIPWDYDVATPQERPLSGSQSALCYLAVELARCGHRVTLICGTGRPRSIHGVECLAHATVPAELWQQPIDALVVVNGAADQCLRLRPGLRAGTPLVLWAHNACDQPGMHPLRRAEVQAGWDAVICVSDWHRRSVIEELGVNGARVVALRNAIAPAFERLFASPEALAQAKGDAPVLAYTSAPFRGLEVLLDVFPAVHRDHPGARLRIFSSMRIYQLDEASDPYAALYRRCRATAGTEYVGALPQARLAEALRAASILAYPSTYAETSSIAVLEAMAAGLFPLTTHLGALPETTMGFGMLVAPAGPEGRVEFAGRYLAALREVLRRQAQDPAAFAAERFEQVQTVNREWTWACRAREWEQAIASWKVAAAARRSEPQAHPGQAVVEIVPSPASWYSARTVRAESSAAVRSKPGKPRLLMVLHSYGILSGVELHVHTLASGLQDRYDIALAYPRGDDVCLLRLQGGETIFPGGKPGWPATPYHFAPLERAFGRIVETFQPDVFHIQHFLHWPLRVIDLAVDTGLPVVLSFHDYYAITPLFTMQGAAEAVQTLSPAYVQATFGSDLTSYLEERRRLLGASLARVRARVAVSPFLQRQLAQLFPETYRIIEYGIQPVAKVPAPPAGPGLRFSYVGNLVSPKGWRSVYEAFAEVRRRHPTAELHFYGSSKDPAPSMAGVTFHGTYQPHDLPRICSVTDVAVIPSLFPETYCLVLSEMWSAGLPVAVSDIGALGERVQDGVNGKKFRPGDVAAIADALSWFAEHKEWRSWQLPQPRRAEAMVADYDRLYQEVLASRPAPAPTPTAPRPAPALQGAARVPGVRAPLQADLLIVQVCEFLDVGDGVYRFHGPSRQLSRLPGVVVIDCDLQHRFAPALVETADVLILAGFDWDMFPLLERRRAAGRITIFEANDYYYDIHPWNPLSARWLDRSIQDSFHQGLTLADAVQTSTPELARRWCERTSRPVAAFPNQLEAIAPLPARAARPLTIGWGGSPGHFADWYQLAPTLERWLLAHPQVHLAVMTHEFARPFVRLPPDRYRFTSFGSLTDYFQFLRGLDIGLAPLLPSDYNRCRSDVKFLEYAAQGVAGIYAALVPYRDSVSPGQTGLLYRTEAELVQALDLLAGNEALRQRIREQAYAHVAQHRRLADHIGDRLAFYRSLLPGPSRGQVVPPEVLGAAECDGRYLQLRRQQPEQTLLAVLGKPSSKESVQSLTGLVQQHPDYLPPLQHLGKQLNDQGDPAAALRYLERARQLQPTSARTLCEIGRAQYLRNEDVRARATLETALTINPYFPPAWQYLLRLLTITRAADGPRWAEQAHQLHPANFALALLGIKVYPAAEGAAVLLRLLEFYAPSFLPDELPAAAAAFSETIRDTVGPVLGSPAALELLRRACAVFPQSAQLANLLGQALWLVGQHEESRTHFVRALELRRAALTVQAEYPKEDGIFYFGQFAEHIQAIMASDGNCSTRS